jgi:hypothetical protein
VQATFVDFERLTRAKCEKDGRLRELTGLTYIGNFCQSLSGLLNRLMCRQCLMSHNGPAMAEKQVERGQRNRRGCVAKKFKDSNFGIFFDI